MAGPAPAATPWWKPTPLDARQVAGAAAVAQVFALYLIVGRWVAPPTAAHWARADPILLILPREATLWLGPVLSVALAAAWVHIARPTAADLRRAALHALAGAAAATGLSLAVRGIAGAQLPSFVPAEESAGPGPILGMTAGYGEEVLFHLFLAPLLFFGLARRLPRIAAAASAIVVTGIAFTLLHEAGPQPSSTAYVITRIVIPGCGMTAVFLLLSPSFLVALHGTAHVWIPILFVAQP